MAELKYRKITALEILSDLGKYDIIFITDHVPRLVRDEFLLAGGYMPILYYVINGTFPVRESVGIKGNLDDCVRKSKLPAQHLFAYAQYTSGCNHRLEELITGKVEGCKCYELFSRLLNESNAVYDIRGHEVFCI
jgi:hypothetical protein